MAYREPGTVPRDPPITVPYGRLTLPWRNVLLGTLFLVVSLILGLVGLRAEELRCARSPSGPGRCVVMDDILVSTWVRLELPTEAVREVRWVPFDDDRGRTELLDRRGRSVEVARGGREDARRAHERIRAFFDDETETTLHLAMPRSWLVAGLGAVFLVLAFIGIVSFFRTVTSVRLRLDRDGLELSATPRRFGWPAKSSSFDLRDLAAIEVEPGQLKTFMAPRYEGKRPAGRLVLVYADGRRSPLTELFLPGERVHVDTARRLGELLAGVESPRPFEAEPAAPIANPHRLRAKHVLLYVAAVAVLAAGGFVAQAFLTRDMGRLEVRCLHRCRMGGLTCLPGGSWSSALPPGEHVVEVWNPDVAGGWEPVVVEVRVGETTVFECRPPR